MPGLQGSVPVSRHRSPAVRSVRLASAILLASSLPLAAPPASAEGLPGPAAVVGLFLPGRHPVQATVPVGPDGSVRVRFGSAGRTAGVAPGAGLGDRKPSSPTSTKGSIDAVIDAAGGDPVVRVEATLRETLILDGGRPETSPENDAHEVFSWSFSRSGPMARARASRRYEHVSVDAVLVIEVRDGDAQPPRP